MTTKNFDACILKLGELNNSFDYFEINGKRCEEILIKCQELKMKMDSTICDFKKELLGNTPIELFYNDGRIGDIFGSLLMGSVVVR